MHNESVTMRNNTNSSVNVTVLFDKLKTILEHVLQPIEESVILQWLPHELFMY